MSQLTKGNWAQPKRRGGHKWIILIVYIGNQPQYRSRTSSQQTQNIIYKQICSRHSLLISLSIQTQMNSTMCTCILAQDTNIYPTSVKWNSNCQHLTHAGIYMRSPKSPKSIGFFSHSRKNIVNNMMNNGWIQFCCPLLAHCHSLL